MTHLILNPIGGYIFVAVVAAVLFGLLFVGPDRARTSRGQRWLLLVIRALVVLLVVVAMLRPALVTTEIKKQSATLVLLFDRSRSMLVTDVLGGKSRWEALRTVLEEAMPLLRELGEDVDIKLYTFDTGVHAVDFEGPAVELGPRPEGEQTAIGAALEEVLRRESGQRVIGVCLLSDGAQRAYAPYDTMPQTAARQLGDEGVPLFTFTFGQATGLGQARDVAVRGLLSSPTVFVKNRMRISGSLRVDGYAGKEIPVQLLFETPAGEMEVVASRRFSTAADGQQLPIEFDYVPEHPGEYKITLQAEPQDGELVTTNNHVSTFVTVRKGGINALYLAGAIRVEERFLQESIDASPDVQLDFVRFDPRNRAAWPQPVADRFAPGRYDVYFIGDLDATALSRQDWQQLADRVREGAGLIMLGGFRSFGAGGYFNTPLGDVLPVRMSRLERQPFDEPVRNDLHWDGPLPMRPAKPVGLRHPTMMLARGQENLALWKRLPALDGANRFARLKPGAVVLAESDDSRRAALLVAGSWAAGRVLAFAGDSTWHWCLEGHAAEHRRFWRQVILYLARKEESTEGRVWIKLERRRYRPGSRVKFTGGAETPEGEAVAGTEFRAVAVLADGERRAIRLARDGKQFTGSLHETQVAGDYWIELTATAAGAPLGEARSRFLVFEQDLELDNPAANPGLLASLARMTAEDGGRALAAEELPDVIRQLRDQPPDLKVERQIKQTYWDTWPFLLLFVALLSTEWYLRKRWRLV